MLRDDGAELQRGDCGMVLGLFQFLLEAFGQSLRV